MSLSTIEQKTREFTELEQTLKEFMADNEEVVATLFDLVEKRNSALAEATHLMKTTCLDEAIKFGHFRRGASSKKKKIIFSRIPTRLFVEFPSVVKSIDEKKLKKLIKDGDIPEELVADITDEYDTSPRITAPAHFDVLTSITRGENG